jgi:hypothetical protein
MGLQNELQDIVDGFETRLTQVARRGYKILGGGTETPPEPEVSVLPIQPREHINGDGDIFDALLSRSAEEVVDALARAGQDVSSDLDEEPNTEPPKKLSTEALEPSFEFSVTADSDILNLPITTTDAESVGKTGAAASDETDDFHARQSGASFTTSSDSKPEFSILPVLGSGPEQSTKKN